ncbi:MAG: hypothetical protein KBH06_01115 [Spirochaetes bacterium]|nr:hypothetical protein [Spirochaetota bacterium]
MKITKIYIIALLIFIISSPVLAANPKRTKNRIPKGSEAAGEMETAYSKEASHDLFGIYYTFAQIYPGIKYSKGITSLSGSFEGISKVNTHKGDSSSLGLFVGFIFDKNQAAELHYDQANYKASVSRFYNDFSTETCYKVKTHEYKLLYRFNLQRYFFKAGFSYLQKRGSGSSKTSISDSTTIKDPSPSSSNSFGTYLSAGHAFSIYKNLHLNTEFYINYPFTNQWKGKDNFKIPNYGISFSFIYLFQL